MNDMETRLQECLIRHVEQLPAGDDLWTGVRTRSRQLRRRRQALTATSVVPVVVAGTVGGVTFAHHASTQPTPPVSFAPATGPSTTPTPFPPTFYTDNSCPDAEHPNYTIDRDNPALTGDDGDPGDALLRQDVDALPIILLYTIGFFVNGQTPDSTTHVMDLADSTGQVNAAYVVSMDPDGSWQAWTATFAGCLAP